MAIWLQPQAVWAYTTAPTTAPSLLPSAHPPTPHIHAGRQDYPALQQSRHLGWVWHRGVQDPSRARPFELLVAAVPCSGASIPSHILSPLFDQSSVIPSSASAHTHLGICFPWPSQHRHPTPNAHMPVSLGSPASQRLVPACTVTVDQQISPSTGLQFLQGGLNPLLSLSSFKHSLLAYTAPYSYLEICTISFPKWLTNSLF